jgi:hypothetical protein
MSCFVVSDFHINALVSWGLRHGAIVGISPDALAHMLAGANRAAFAERYLDDPGLVPFAGFDRPVDPSHLAPVAIVKACDCLDYQCSDWTSWSGAGSEPAAHLAAIRAAALALALAGLSIAARASAGGLDYGRELPGYDAADWHLDEPEPEPRPFDLAADRLAAALADMTAPELAVIRSAMAARGAA